MAQPDDVDNQATSQLVSVGKKNTPSGLLLVVVLDKVRVKLIKF
jgi:hypothetical protein